MPPLDQARLLAQWFVDVGPCGTGAMGPVPIGWGEMAQWQRLSGTPLQPWQARALRAASAAYVSQLLDSEDPHAAAPWGADPAPEQRELVAKKLRAAFGARAAPAAR